MTNPFDPGYLGSASADFGILAWGFFALQIAGFVAGLYLVYVRRDSNMVRKASLQWLGTALVVAGGIGIMLAMLRLSAVQPFMTRYWFYLLLALEIVLAGYITYYARLVYPKKLAHSQTSRGKTGTRQSTRRETAAAQTGSNGKTVTSATSEDSTAARSGRREARQRRKRKQRH
jgi:hypothetical protein